MDLQQLRVFREAVRAGGFTRASEEMHLSQSTISLHIKRLEEELGVPLFLRTKRRVQLNEAGQVLLGYVDRIFQELTNAEHALQELGHSEKGVVRLGSGGTTLTYLLPKVLAAYRRRFPQVELILTTDSSEGLAHGVHAGKLDLAVVMHPVRPELSVELLPILHEELVFVVGNAHDFGERDLLEPEEVNDVPFISFLQGSTMQVQLDRQFLSLGIKPKITMEMENIEAIKAVVRAGLGVAVLPLCSISSRDGSLRALRVRGQSLHRELALALPRGASPSRAVQRFANRLTRRFTGKTVSQLRSEIASHGASPEDDL